MTSPSIIPLSTLGKSDKNPLLHAAYFREYVPLFVRPCSQCPQLTFIVSDPEKGNLVLLLLSHGRGRASFQAHG
jgi:hypothetical protein